MPLGEFELIAKYFSRNARPASASVHAGVGDDCALLAVSPGHILATSTDLLVEGRHFFADVNPQRLGHKALAVNLSDLAACGAQPLAFLLGLSLPKVDEAWLSEFAGGLFALADAQDCALIGGDTSACSGPLTISITVLGQVPAGLALMRSGAKVGDRVYVSGQLGAARLALDHRLTRCTLPPAALALAIERLELPTPRLALGQALRGIASACIDLSDGLCGDVQHLLNASGVGADLSHAALLSTSALEPLLPADFPSDCLFNSIVSGGDDYELLFTADAAHADAIATAAKLTDTAVHHIGQISAAPGLRILDAQGQAIKLALTSFDHFSPAP